MKSRNVAILLIGIYAITLAVRLFFAFSTPTFSGDSAYFVLRQIENIQETGLPLIFDELSYGGRSLYHMPVFYYILAFFGFFMSPEWVGKIIPNAFAASLVFVVYLNAKYITKDTNIALLTSAISSFIPIYFAETVNSISPLSIVVPLVFLTTYFVIRTHRMDSYANFAVPCIVLLSFIHPSSFLFVLALLFYLLLVKIEKIALRRSELELIIFASFLIFLTQFILFKKALLVHGPFVIWQNIPQSVLNEFFRDFTILGSISAIGIIPFFCGIYVVYKYTLREKMPSVYLLLGFVLSISLLLWMMLIHFEIGLIFLGIVLVLLFSQSLLLMQTLVHQSRVSRMYNLFLSLLVLLILITSVIPTLSLGAHEILDSYSASDINAMAWMQNNTDTSATVLALPEKGHLITYFGRRNVMDNDYLLVTDAQERLRDVHTIYTTPLETEAVRLLNKYGISYIVLSADEKEAFDIDRLSFTDDERCFEQVYNDTSDKDGNGTYQIFNSLCRLD